MWTEPQPFANDKRKFWPRGWFFLMPHQCRADSLRTMIGKMLGGCILFVQNFFGTPSKRLTRFFNQCSDVRLLSVISTALLEGLFFRAQYGSPQDFDEWAKIIGDDSWGWRNFRQSVLTFFVKFC